MNIAELRPLKQALLNEYGHFADKRLKNIDKGSHFIIDERENGRSFGADGTPYGWFCEIFAEVESSSSLRIIIRGPLPTGPLVERWMEENGATLESNRVTFRDNRSFRVTPTDMTRLLTLASALESLIAKDKQREKSDYFVCPRMAANFRRLHTVLQNRWSS